MRVANVLLVTGTDTDVGKTVVACGLLSALHSAGFRTAALKPIAAGASRVQGNWVNDDALRLQASASVQLPLATVNPRVFAEPIAPHLAAGMAGQSLTVDDLLEASRPALHCAADYLVVEGAGGWLVPLNDRETLADYARALAAEVVLVVGIKLGCINHALLTAAAIEASGLRLAGWVANHVAPDTLASAANVEALRGRLRAPLLGEIDYMRNVDSAACAACLDISLLNAPRPPNKSNPLNCKGLNSVNLKNK